MDIEARPRATQRSFVTANIVLLIECASQLVELVSEHPQPRNRDELHGAAMAMLEIGQQLTGLTPSERETVERALDKIGTLLRPV